MPRGAPRQMLNGRHWILNRSYVAYRYVWAPLHTTIQQHIYIHMQQILPSSGSIKPVPVQQPTDATRALWTPQAHYSVVKVSIRHYNSISSSIKTHPQYHAHCSFAMFPVIHAHGNDILKYNDQPHHKVNVSKCFHPAAVRWKKRWNEWMAGSCFQADL